MIITYAYIGLLIYFSIVLISVILKKPDNWNWLMAAMVLAPWILRILRIK